MQIPVVRVALPRCCYVHCHFSQLYGKLTPPPPPSTRGVCCYVRAFYEKIRPLRFKGQLYITFFKSSYTSAIIQPSLCIISSFLSHRKEIFPSPEKTWILQDKHNPELLPFFSSPQYCESMAAQGPPYRQWWSDKCLHPVKMSIINRLVPQSWWPFWYDKHLALIRIAYLWEDRLPLIFKRKPKWEGTINYLNRTIFHQREM